MFKLVKPCAKCPFRRDVGGYLTRARAREIASAITAQDATFSCHETVTYDDDGKTVRTSQEQHCAGAAILLEKIGRANQMMRIMERIGAYDRTKLDMEAPVFDTPSEFIAHHGNKQR